MIKSLPIEENPREKAKLNGIESLTNVELLALVLRTGNKNQSVIELCNSILKEIGGFNYLASLNYNQLTSIKGIGEAKAIGLLAIIEMSKRLKSKPMPTYCIREPEAAYNYCKDDMMLLDQEHFDIICLDSRKHVVKRKTVFKGSLNASLVVPRDVFKEAIQVNSSKILLVHNHPSGDPTPSTADIAITANFEELGLMMGIEIVDHIIIGWNSYFSIKSNHLYKR